MPRYPKTAELVRVGSIPAGSQSSVLASGMMLEFLGHKEAHDAILSAIEKTLAPGSGAPRTPDLGGTAGTADVGKAIASAV